MSKSVKVKHPNQDEPGNGSEVADETDERRPNIVETANFLEPVHVRSFTLTGIFLLLALYALKIGSDFFVPVMLAFLLSFLFAPVVRILHRLYIPLCLGAALVLLGQTQGFLVSGGVMFVRLFFLLASGDMFLRKLVTVLPRFENKKLAVEISRQIEHDISRYLLTVTLINAAFGSAVGLSMYFIGLPNAL